MSAGVMAASVLPSAAKVAVPLCNQGNTICVWTAMRNAKVSSPLRIQARISAKDDVQVTWELKDDTGASLASGSTWQERETLRRRSTSAEELDARVFLIDPAKSDHGLLILTPVRTDVSSEKVNLPSLSIPLRLETETTELTILMPKDVAGYDADVQAYADEPKPTDFAPKTPLVPQTVTVMKVDESSRMAATAQAVLRAMPAQGGPWHVESLVVENGTVHLKLSSDAWAGVSSYWLAMGYLLEKSLEQFPGVRQVEFK
jgi:hypothetical protein